LRQASEKAVLNAEGIVSHGGSGLLSSYTLVFHLLGALKLL
jgi:hypothetical protein